MHISILKLQYAYVEDYYYNKMGGYNIVTPTIVDCKKSTLNCLWFLFSCNVNDS